MSFEVTDTNGVTRVVLTGEIDLEQSPAAREAVLEAVGRGRSVEVDLADVSYIDSSGIASLVEGLQQARSHDVDFALCRVSDPVRKVLELARLDRVFTLR